MNSIHIAISIASLSFSGGIVAGMFMSKFMSKKECQSKSDAMWAQVDAIRNCMTGGRILFELKMVKQSEQ